MTFWMLHTGSKKGLMIHFWVPALCPSKSGLMNKHCVKHCVKTNLGVHFEFLMLGSVLAALALAAAALAALALAAAALAAAALAAAALAAAALAAAALAALALAAAALAAAALHSKSEMLQNVANKHKSEMKQTYRETYREMLRNVAMLISSGLNRPVPV
jgi:hypothetical protein